MLVAMLCIVYEIALDGTDKFKVWGDASAYRRPFCVCVSVARGRRRCLCSESTPYGGAM